MTDTQKEMRQGYSAVAISAVPDPLAIAIDAVLAQWQTVDGVTPAWLLDPTFKALGAAIRNLAIIFARYHREWPLLERLHEVHAALTDATELLDAVIASEARSTNT